MVGARNVGAARDQFRVLLHQTLHALPFVTEKRQEHAAKTGLGPHQTDRAERSRENEPTMHVEPRTTARAATLALPCASEVHASGIPALTRAMFKPTPMTPVDATRICSA